MLLTRQHFALIAATLADERETYDPSARVALDALDAVTRAFARELANTNRNFDRDRFLKAAGVTT